jgi:hypothetical protein
MLTSRASQGPFEGGRRSTPGGQQLGPSGSLTRPHHPPEQTETRHLDLTGSDIRTRSDQSREPMVRPLSGASGKSCGSRQKGDAG